LREGIGPERHEDELAHTCLDVVLQLFGHAVGGAEGGPLLDRVQGQPVLALEVLGRHLTGTAHVIVDVDQDQQADGRRRPLVGVGQLDQHHGALRQDGRRQPHRQPGVAEPGSAAKRRLAATPDQEAGRAGHGRQ
jgi:hypothetical protein